MPFTNAQTQAFFQDNDQMAIDEDTMEAINEQGLDSVSDLADFDKDDIERISSGLRRPPGRVPDPNPNAPLGATIPTPPFVFGAKSHHRLLVAADLVRFYVAIGRPITAGNMMWDPIMKNFEIQWKALVNKAKDRDIPETPKITKTLLIIKWVAAFGDHMHRVVGARNIPLAYVIRPNAEEVDHIGDYNRGTWNPSLNQAWVD